MTDERTDAFIRSIARGLDNVLNPGCPPKQKSVGFALVLYDFNEGPNEKNCNYVGNGQRQDVFAALKEIVARWEGRYQSTETQQ